MKKNILFSVMFICLSSLVFSQHYTINYDVKPVDYCKWSTSTSVHWNIKCDTKCKAVIDIQDSDGSWRNLVVKKSDEYGNIKYISFGLRFNTSPNYRFFVYSANDKIDRFKLNENQFDYKTIYVKKICK